MAWNNRIRPDTNYVDGDLWSVNYYPWLESSFPWQKTTLNTNWNNREVFLATEDYENILLESGEEIYCEQQPVTNWINRIAL